MKFLHLTTISFKASKNVCWTQETSPISDLIVKTFKCLINLHKQGKNIYKLHFLVGKSISNRQKRTDLSYIKKIENVWSEKRETNAKLLNSWLVNS